MGLFNVVRQLKGRELGPFDTVQIVSQVKEGSPIESNSV
jgi:hypothetical protein